MTDKQSSQTRTAKFYDDIVNTRIRELMDEAKNKGGSLTEDFARAMRVSSSAIRTWYTGYARPEIDKLSAIARYFNVSADWLLGIVDDPVSDTEIKAMCERLGLSSKSIKILEDFKAVRAGCPVDVVNRLIETTEIWMNINTGIDYIAGYEPPGGHIYKHSDMMYVVPGLYFKIQKDFTGFLKTLVDEAKKSDKAGKFEWVEKMVLHRQPICNASRKEDTNAQHNPTQK